MLLENDVLKYQVMEGNTFTASGTIKNTGRIAIYEDFDITTVEKSLTVVVWLDGEPINVDNQEEILSSTYKGSIGLEVESR